MQLFRFFFQTYFVSLKFIEDECYGFNGANNWCKKYGQNEFPKRRQTTSHSISEMPFVNAFAKKMKFNVAFVDTGAGACACARTIYMNNWNWNGNERCTSTPNYVEIERKAHSFIRLFIFFALFSFLFMLSRTIVMLL